QLRETQPGRRTDSAQVRETQPGRRTDSAQVRETGRSDSAQVRETGRRTEPAQVRETGRRSDPAAQMRDARARPGRPDSPREPSGGHGGRGTPDGGPGDEPPADELQIAAGGGTIPLVDVDGDDDRARRATVPSWDDILLGVRRKH
ncbi:MAG TPA: hypothetical protein VLM05_02810, partial [Mycobacteriales bacterium]|nr:hypothetical protein [Mycobacteriales bacterium]